MAHDTRSPALIALGGLLALAAAMGIGRFVYTPILPFMTESMSLSPADAGWIASANFFGYLVGALGASMGTLPGSRRMWFIGALFVSALSTAAMGTTISITAFLVLRFVGGMASAFVLVFSSALILERLSEAGRPGLSSVHFAGVGFGIALSAILVAGLADYGLGWRGLWVASGVMTLLCLGLAVFFVPGEPTAEPTAEQLVQQRTRPSSPFIRLVIAYGLFGFGYVITATFISVIVHDKAALNPAEPYVWFAVGLSAAPSIYFWNKMGAIAGGPLAFSIACILEAIGVALSVIAQTPFVVLIAAVLVGGTFMGITAMGLIEARKQSPNATRQALAIMTASFGLGQMIGPWLAGQLRQATGSYDVASFVAAGALVLAAGLVRR